MFSSTCVCVCVFVHPVVHTWQSEHSLQELVLSFCHLGPENQSNVVRLSCKLLTEPSLHSELVETFFMFSTLGPE